MPSLPANIGGMPPQARKAPSTGSHLADTGHTAQSHWEQHQHVFVLTCRECGHTQQHTEHPLTGDINPEIPGNMAVFHDPHFPRAVDPMDVVFIARELQAEIDEILNDPNPQVIDRLDRYVGAAGSDTVTDMPARTWVLNTKTGTLHDRGMLSERCNTDQIPRSARAVARNPDELLAHPRFKAKCGWCHPKVVENPNAPAEEA